MEDFVKWIMRTNARAVFISALAALALVTGWWTWLEFSPVDFEAHVPQSALKDKPFLTLGLIEYLDAQKSLGVRVPDNLFLVSQGPRRIIRVQPVKPDPTPTPTPMPAPTPAPTPTPAPAPPARIPDTVSLIYRGILQRPDGQKLALIESSKTGRSSFYKKGTTVYGVTVDEITIDHVTLVDKAEVIIPLRVGETKVFEDGRHAR